MFNGPMCHRNPFAILFCMLLVFSASSLHAQEKATLIEAGKDTGGFRFDNGREFPGAKGDAKLIDTDQGKAVQLTGDFSGGGAYVQILRKTPLVDPSFLSFEAKVIGCKRVTLRLIDVTNQCHQITLNIKDIDDWQRITLPVHAFFQNMGRASAVESVAKYERWGGAKDGKWHGPIKTIAIIGGSPTTADKTFSITVRDLYMMYEPQDESPSQASESQPQSTNIKPDWHDITLNIGEVPNLSTYIVGKNTSAKAMVLKDTDDSEFVQLKMHVEKAGTYVGASIHTAEPVIQSLEAMTLELRSTTLKHFSMRLKDGTGQTHQTKWLKINPDGQWHTYTFPINKISGGETWGGAKDRKWHDPVKSFAFAIGADAVFNPDATLDIKRLSFKGVAPKTQASDAAWLTLPLLIEDFADVSTFVVGKGLKAKASVTQDDDKTSFIRVNYAFPANGYSGVVRSVADTPISQVKAIQLTLRTDTVRKIGTQLKDGTGQTHQAKNIPLISDGKWHTYTFPLVKLVGAESWGGAKDRQWHDPLTLLNITTATQLAEKEASLDIKAIKVFGVSLDPTLNTPEPLAIDFEAADAIKDWETSNQTVGIKPAVGFENSNAMQLLLTEQEVLDKKAFAYSPTFPAAKGWWKIAGVFAGQLYSPDNSFAGITRLQCLDINGKPLESFELNRCTTKEASLQSVSREIRLPDGTAKARFMIDMVKTHGTYTVDQLSFSFIKPVENTEDLIERIVIKSDALGNLFMPQDKLAFDVTLMAKRPLSEANRQLDWHVVDYWGIEQTVASVLTLQKDGRNKSGLFEYVGKIDLTNFKASQGQYYELALTALRDAPRAYKDYRSFAILPEAQARKHSWKDIPFSSRNWDNRITEYIDLSARLGLPIIGAWTSWQATPPYKTNLPGVKRILDHNVAVMAATPMGGIEKHHGKWQAYDETAMRQGLTNIFNQINQDQMVITMGNEPPNNYERAMENLWAYKAMYETAKSLNPNVTMVGTSVGASEAYFKAGVHQYCDVVDFHVYESHQRIRKVFERYDELFKQYGHRKPIWSTEIGLNSQGVPRRDVASSLIKKFSIFFACGGENISWFGLLYPDSSGKSSGSSGDSHNVFDCRYRVYSPRLDAIAYYNMINSICVKKFVTEEKYVNDVEAYLFADKDQNQLQILWTDKDPKTMFVPLADVQQVTVTYVDGVVRQMNAAGEGLTLRVTPDPILLQYKSKNTTLPRQLPDAKLTIDQMPNALVMGGQANLKIANGISGSKVISVMPTQWGGSVEATGDTLAMRIPANSSARYMPLSVQQHDSQGRLRGEIRQVLPIVGRIAMQVRPTLVDEKPAVKVQITNNGYEPQKITWRALINSSLMMHEGTVSWATKAGPAMNEFTGDTSGNVTLSARKTHELILPIKHVNPMQIDRALVSVRDAQGREIQIQRYLSAFCGVPRTNSQVAIDGQFDEADWAKAKVQLANHKQQYHTLKKERQWEGVDDLSAKIRFMWDDDHLYLAVQARDNVHSHTKTGGALWNQDGIQLMVDPARGSSQQGGKYDLVMGENAEGKAYAWSHLAADPAVPTGPVPDIKVAVKRDESAKRTCYEIAIPWGQISPFKPGVGANLGMAVALNEDDGDGRVSFLSWFADVHAKQTDGVADLILLP